MLIQGDLQLVFDALYNLGVIDPVLKMDWTERLQELTEHEDILADVVSVVNGCGRDSQLLQYELGKFDKGTLEFLAMEVARE